jgi:hypothetical protein
MLKIRVINPMCRPWLVPLGPCGHGSIHPPDHWLRRPCGNDRWCCLCRMFNRALRGRRWMPNFLSSDNDPLYRFHQWQANLRILEVTEIKSVPYVPLSCAFRGSDRFTVIRSVQKERGISLSRRDLPVISAFVAIRQTHLARYQSAGPLIGFAEQVFCNSQINRSRIGIDVREESRIGRAACRSHTNAGSHK